MIKIVSGYSEKGGSTSAFIDLTNELNNRKNFFLHIFNINVKSLKISAVLYFRKQ